jgi:hypothetical protein
MPDKGPKGKSKAKNAKKPEAKPQVANKSVAQAKETPPPNKDKKK